MATTRPGSSIPRYGMFRLRLADPRPHLAGQHYIVRLTAPGGYRAQRSYPVASAPGGDIIELTVEHLPGGEVSGFLHEAVMPGDLAPVLRQGRAAYVCGSPAFCDSVTAMLEHLHVPAARVGVERFGPSG